jgi:hypothetical protein
VNTIKNLKDKLYERADNIVANNIPLANQSVIQDTNNTNVIQLNQVESCTVASIVPDFAISIDEAKTRIAMLQNFVKQMMVQDIDYGIIPGCKKPSLYKAGAEKLCDIFAFSKQINVINRLEDWEKGIFHYEIKATLISKRTGYIEAEGIGCCNSKEKKYKDLPSFNIINTVLKMAKKRALIDAVLSATRSSGLFTQDIEDLEGISKNDAITAQYANDINLINTKDTIEHSTQNNNQTVTASKKQLSLILSLVEKSKIPFDEMKKILLTRYKINESKELDLKQADDLIKYLNNVLLN